MLREPVRRDRIVTILPSGKVRPVAILRPPYSFPHVGRKRISEETGAARRGQLRRGPPHGFRRVQGFAFTSYCNDGARHAADHQDPTVLGTKRKAPPAPRPKRRRKTKAAPVEPVLSEYELGRRAKIKRNNKFLVSVGLLFPPQEALEDDEHPWWYMTAR